MTDLLLNPLVVVVVIVVVGVGVVDEVGGHGGSGEDEVDEGEAADGPGRGTVRLRLVTLRDEELGPGDLVDLRYTLAWVMMS